MTLYLLMNLGFAGGGAGGAAATPFWHAMTSLSALPAGGQMDP